MSDLRLKRIDTSKLWPPFVKLIETLMSRTVPYYAISGYRSVEEQNGLFAQGRTKPGKIVTNAKGGQSLHNFGCAVDFAFDTDEAVPGLQPGWAFPSYNVLAGEARKIPGLESGFFWKFIDPGHVQVDLAALKLTLADLMTAHTVGGMPAVFAVLNKAVGL